MNELAECLGRAAVLRRATQESLATGTREYCERHGSLLRSARRGNTYCRDIRCRHTSNPLDTTMQCGTNKALAYAVLQKSILQPASACSAVLR